METRCMLLLITAILITTQDFVQCSISKTKKDVNRKSIVFDIKTPKVFYCQQDKQSDQSKMIVKAKPLEKLCEFDGEPKPKGKPSDCFNDIDESKYACDEKKRFQQRLKLRVDTLSELEAEQSAMIDPDITDSVFLKNLEKD